MSDRTKRKILPAIFYRTAAGSEPVRDWLKGLSRDDKRIVGQDIATVEFGWPVGMPHCRSLAGVRLWIRSFTSAAVAVSYRFFMRKLYRNLRPIVSGIYCTVAGV